MKLTPLLDAEGAQALDAAWLLETIAPVSEYGARAFEAMRPFAPGEETAAAARAREVAALASGMEETRLDAAREVLRGVADAAVAIARASMGETLGDANLLELQRFFDAIERIDALVRDVASLEPVGSPATREVARALELGRAGKFGFYLADDFDAALARARAAHASAQAAFDAACGRATAATARALNRDALPPDEFIVMRDDLPAAGLPAGLRVVREAPTYLLCAPVFDEATRAALERRDAAATAIAAAEEAVRAALSDAVRARVPELDAAAERLGALDVLLAAARFARTQRCEVAEIAPGAALSFEGARFLPLEARLEREGRSFAPIALALSDVCVLTGPNMGGKSVALRTAGFVALCAALGLPVPATRARVGLFDEIAWLGIGVDEGVGGLLSSFAKEVVRLRDVLARRPARLCVLIDEFARTTTPNEGKALVVALLRTLRERGACGIVATHLGGVASAAGAPHFAVRGLRDVPQRPPDGDLVATLAALAASMDYTIDRVTADSPRPADAIALAALLGLDAEVVAGAHAALRGAPPADR